MKKLLVAALLICSYSLFAQGNCYECIWRNYRNSINTGPPFNPADSANRWRMDKVMKGLYKTLDSLVGCKAPDFTVKTIDGKILSMSQLKDKVIVLNFWFNTCEPCVDEIPALNRLVEDYKNMDVVFIAISRDYEPAVKKFLEYTPFDYNMVSNGEATHEIFCPGAGYPVNMVIDRKGIVRKIFCGGATNETAKTHAYNIMQPVINTCLKEY